MNKYVIVTDSCSDLPKAFREEHHIDYAKMNISWTDSKGELHESIADLDWEVLSSKEFYDIIRSGIRIYTAQPTIQNYLDTFEKHLKKGKDVLYLACSSGLSASLKTAEMLANTELKERYPDNKVVVIDTLRAGMSLGMMIIDAFKLYDAGKSMDEVISFINKEKLKYKEIGIPDSLTYLKRAGRVTGPAALMGNLIHLKPILMFNDDGTNEVKEKTVGKKKAFLRMAEIVKEDIVEPENQTLYLMSADCKTEDLEGFKNAVLSLVKVKEIIVQPLGPIIGAVSGPGTMILNYKGK